MSGSWNDEVDLPEDLPPEHADAYRAAYLRARHGSEAAGPSPERVDDGGASTGRGRDDVRRDDGHEPTRQLDLSGVRAASSAGPAAPSGFLAGVFSDEESASPASQGAFPGASPGGSPGGSPGTPGTAVPSGSHAAVTPPPPRRRRKPSSDEDDAAHRPSALVIVGLAGLAVLLVVGAFMVGRVLADGSASGGSVEDATTAGEDGGAAPYDGPVEAVRATGGSASCQAPDSVDEAGNPVSYPPWQAFDGDLSTAWRCQGSGEGSTLRITLPEGARVAEVGLVPGYAKTDPASGVDRYAENNRITRVRWTLEDGSSYVQEMNADPNDRSMRTMRVPESETGTLALEVLASARGPRNTVAVSEIRVAAPAG